MDVDEVIARYQNADEHERLCLFLEHRALRQVFSTIDREAEWLACAPDGQPEKADLPGGLAVPRYVFPG